MRNLFAFLLLFTMTSSMAISVFGQWKTSYEWSKDGKEESQKEGNKTEEGKTEKEAEEELFQTRCINGYLISSKSIGQEKKHQMTAFDLERLRSQCHGALPDLPPKA